MDNTAIVLFEGYSRDDKFVLDPDQAETSGQYFSPQPGLIYFDSRTGYVYYDTLDINSKAVRIQTRVKNAEIANSAIAAKVNDQTTVSFEDAFDITGDNTVALKILGGGTGANDAAGARTNLEVYSKQEVDEKLNNTSSAQSYSTTISASDWEKDSDSGLYTYAFKEESLRCTISPIVSCTMNPFEFNKIISAEGSTGMIVFRSQREIRRDMTIVIIDQG